MDTVFLQNGIDYLRWTDENGNTWEARLDEVEWFGKEVFEQMPIQDGLERNLSDWSVTFNDREGCALPEPTEEDYEYADSWFEGNGSAFAMPDFSI